jgi:hypothetical protein
MQKLRSWFIGDYLRETDNVFERAKIELLFNFTFVFCLVGGVYYTNLIVHHLWYHVYLISFAVVALLSVPFVLKYTKSVRIASNWYVTQHLINAIGSTFIQEGKGDMNGSFWLMLAVLFSFFLYGKKWGLILTLLFFVAGSIPFFFMKYYDVPEHQQIPNTPDFFLVPFFLNVYVAWMFIKTREAAEEKINRQKELLETKNSEITDSIHYAKRIQTSLMTNEKYIVRVLKKLKKQV